MACTTTYYPLKPGRQGSQYHIILRILFFSNAGLLIIMTSMPCVWSRNEFFRRQSLRNDISHIIKNKNKKYSHISIGPVVKKVAFSVWSLVAVLYHRVLCLSIQYTFFNNNTPYGEQRWAVLIRQLLHTFQWQHATQWATLNCFNQTIVHCADSYKQSIAQRNSSLRPSGHVCESIP